MAKIYTKKDPKELEPKRESISFLLNYSKSMRIVKTAKNSFRFHLN